MSDTDDTDLLLLIPPDFFLVRSDFEDYDSDFEIGLGPQDIKDSIVSDLITQVNDLESRVCQIESLERTSTRCSTCNEDSFINQSIVSLTESDVLRGQIKDQRELLKKESTVNSFMVNSPNNDISPGLMNVKEIDSRITNSTLLTPELSERNSKDELNDNTGNSKNVRVSHLTQDTQNNKLENKNNPLIIQGQLTKEKQTQLLNEVDSFLLSKQLNSEGTESLEINNHKEIDQNSPELHKILMNNASVANHSPPLAEDDFKINTSDDEHVQSLALTEVYRLITEMEETQAEMEKKLNVNSSKLSLQLQDKSRPNDITGRGSMKTTGKVLDLEDLSTKSPKNVLDALRLSNHTETNYGFPQLPPSTEEKPIQRTSKSLSPHRSAIDGYNAIDIMRANLPGRQDGRSSQFGDRKHSPRKSSGFRRQLQFEKPLSPLRNSPFSKSKTSLQGDQKSSTFNENQDKNENERFVAPSLGLSRPVSINHSLEERFNSLVVQRARGINYKDNQNVHHNIMNKPASETLQQKLSSNQLLSLSELWNKEPSFYSDDPNKLRQKLEEERYRRQHCEQQIQALQLRVLEEQEKLAVAVRVDQEKDRAIMQITESWKKLNEHWGELEEQRHGLAQQLQVERESSKRKSEELNKKVERWEKEVSQALDLAAGYKEKCEDVQKQMEHLQRVTDQRLQQVDEQLQNITGQKEKLTEENKSLSEQLKSFQQRLKEEEDLLSKLKDELEKCRKRIDEFEAENIVLKEQKSSLTTSIKEERNRTSILEKKLNSLQQALNEANKKEKAAQEEVRVSQERVEVARTELRALYQGQLEAVVKEKLQEFQLQLEAAEAALKAELQAKEKQWAEKANEQYRQLHDKYKRDLLRVEQIHKGDINIWREKLSESEKQRAAVEKRLQEEADRRADIAQRLHGVMETQWREALSIISNPVKALYEMPKEENTSRWPQQQGPSPERLPGEGVRASRSESTASLGPVEDVPFCQEGLVTYRTTQPAQDLQLKKYIQMLLERGPGNPVPPQNTIPDGPEHLTSNDLLDKWILENEKKTSGQSERQNQFSKPPWR